MTELPNPYDYQPGDEWTAETGDIYRLSASLQWVLVKRGNS